LHSRKITQCAAGAAAGDSRPRTPLAKSHRDRIAQLRELVLSGQARNASRGTVNEEVKVEQVRGERRLDIG